MVELSNVVKHKHHIIPKHMGGSDDPENIVEVTVEKHAELHRQLWEDLGNWQDYVAWQGLIKNAENADLIRLKQSLAGRMGGLKLKGIPKSAEHRKKMSETRKGKPSNMLGKKHSAETIAKLSKPKSSETIAKMKKPKSSEHHDNISAAMKGLKRTPEQKERYRLAALKRWAKPPAEQQEKGGVL